MRDLAIDLIRVDGGTQIRVETDVTQVESYAEDMAAGDVFPAIIVYFDGSEYWLADGFHRILAAKKLGLAEISADVRGGGRRDAILYAVGANAAHGLKRSNRDKRNAVTILLEDPEWVQWTDVRIADQCGVSSMFVGNLRRTIIKPFNDAPIRTATRGGTTYTMKVENIGDRPEAAPRPTPAPEWRQTDIEDFAPPAPEPLPFPTVPVGDRLAGAEIRRALETIASQIRKLTPAEVAEAAAGELWTDAANAEKVIPWLTEFARLVPDEMSRRERLKPYLKGYRRGASGY